MDKENFRTPTELVEALREEGLVRPEDETLLQAIAEEAELREAAELQARRDPLTEVGNALAFQEELAKAGARAERFDEPASVMVLDLVGLSAVNENGQNRGDEALKKFAAALSNSVRKVDTVARVGGDEFALILPKLGKDQLHLVLERLDEQLADPENAVCGQQLDYYAAFEGSANGRSIDSAYESAQEEIAVSKKARKNGQV